MSLDIVELWDGLSDSCQRILVAILNSIPQDQATFLIATSNSNYILPDRINELFNRPWKDKFTVEIPTQEQRSEYFNSIKASCLKVETSELI